MSLREGIIADSDELLERVSRGNGKAAAQPDLDRIIHGLHLELASVSSRLGDLEAKMSALHRHHNNLVQTLNREFKEKNLSARLGQLEQRHEGLGKRVAAVEEKGIGFAGVYQRACEYSKHATVCFDGSWWIAIADVKVNEVPGKHPSWALGARQGRDGKDALSGDTDASTRRLPTKPRSTGLR